jgi:PIN domain nuclease of toxin-antitoxin system
VKVVADSQAILWYLNAPHRLSEKALRWLEDAEHEEGIVVSAATVPEVWMAVTRKRGPRAVSRAEYELLRDTLLAAGTTLDVEPVGLSLWSYFEEASTRIKDPFDALIVATALHLEAPLVSADDAINKAGLVQVIW